MKQDELKDGIRIKFALPSIWCQVICDSPFVWFKGKIIKVYPSKKAILVKGTNRKFGMKISRLSCHPDKNGDYSRIKQIYE